MKKTKPKTKAVVSRSVGAKKIQPTRKVQWLAIGVFAVVAGALLFKTFAGSTYSTKPNDIVLQYVQPHNDVYAENQLSDAHYPPLTLYGNGLLICTPGTDHVFTAPNLPEEGATHAHSTVPTSRIMGKTEMANFVQSIRDTGFESLDPEYFEFPVAQNQYTVRLVLKGAEKNVLYYNDVTPPAAYVQTLALMKDACAKTTQPYISATATVRALANSVEAGAETNALDAFDQLGVNSLKDVMTKSKDAKAKNDAKRAAGQEPELFDESIAAVSGATAQVLQQTLNGKAKKNVIADGINYTISVDPDMPLANNPMELDIPKLRAETEKKKANQGKSTTQRVFDAIDPSDTAYAQTTASKGYRIVLLLPSSGGSSDKSDEAKSMASKMNQWLCKEATKCPTYKGVSVLRGSQTQAYYNTCHSESGCQSNQLLAIMRNVATKDSPSIYRSDVATIVVPGWKTNTLGTSGTKACGWGSSGGTISAIDLYQTVAINGLTCNPLSKVFPHEYLHNLSLSHVSQCTNKNLMDGPPGCKYSNGCTIVLGTEKTCVLWDGQANALKNSVRY